MSKHELDQTCPICLETRLRHVHCTYAACTFVVTSCPSCDRDQAVAAFVADHEKDCAFGPGMLRRVPVRFSASRLAS